MELQTKLPLVALFMLLFTLAGPIKLFPVFNSVASHLGPRERRSLAIKASLFALSGIVLAALMGVTQVEKAGISREALGTAAGLVLTIVGLMPLVGIERRKFAEGKVDALGFAFPYILAPHTFGLIILFSLYAASPLDTIGIILVGAALMLLNALAMLCSGWVMRKIGMIPLRMFGAIFGIIQLALGIEILFWGLRTGLLRLV